MPKEMGDSPRSAHLFEVILEGEDEDESDLLVAEVLTKPWFRRSLRQTAGRASGM